MPGLARVHIKVYGRVQGVFFRAYTREIAQELNVRGWVRNCEDGSVEIVAEGEREKLEQLVEAARRGPPLAYVEKVEIEWQDYRGEFSGFYIKR